MLEVYQIPSKDMHFPRKFVGHFDSPEQLMNKLKLSPREVTDGLSGNVVRGKYLFEFDSKFMHELALDSLIEKHIDNLSYKEISEELGISEKKASDYMSRAVGKIKKMGKERQIVNAILKLKQSQRIKKERKFEFEMDSDPQIIGDYEVITKTRINVSIDDFSDSQN